MFADPTGRRFRMLRVAGITATAALTVCLGAVVVALTGGPSAPFTQWAVPRQAAGTAGHGTQHGAGQAGMTASPSPVGGTRTATAAPAGGPSASPAPSAAVKATAAPSPAASVTASPAASAATNPAGRTPPRHTRTKSANPHASASVA